MLSGDKRVTRKPNFGIKEKAYLIKLVEENKDVLFAKFNGGITNDDKSIGWQEIANKLTLDSGITRTGEEVRKKWTNFQSTIKTKLANKSRETSIEDETFLTYEEIRAIKIMGEGNLKGSTCRPYYNEYEDNALKSELISPDPNQYSYPSSPGISSDSAYSELVTNKKRKTLLIEKDQFQRELIAIKRERLEIEKEKVEIFKESLKVQRETLLLQLGNSRTYGIEIYQDDPVTIRIPEPKI